jgi:hypothetical protein
MAWSAARVKPGGVAVVSVPALPRLFSHFDTIQGHRRRYEPATLRRAFEGSGLEVETVIWWGAWMVPVLARQRARKTPPRQAAERTYADYLRLPPWPVPRPAPVDRDVAVCHRPQTGRIPACPLMMSASCLTAGWGCGAPDRGLPRDRCRLRRELAGRIRRTP